MKRAGWLCGAVLTLWLLLPVTLAQAAASYGPGPIHTSGASQGHSAGTSVSREAVISPDATTIVRGQTVKDVVVVGNDATVAGRVSEVLLVLDGDVHLTSTARAGIVVDLGGHITADRGAQVDAIYHAAMSTPFWNGALFGVMFFLLAWAGMLIVEMGLLVLSVLIAHAFRRQIGVPLRFMEQSVRRTGITGVLISLAFLAVGALCALTIVGLPIAVVLLLVYLVGGVVGFSVVSLWVGNLALRNSVSERPVWVRSLLGTSLMMAFVSIPFIGLLLFCIFWLVGVGTTSAWLLRGWRRGVRGTA
jgi:hypothetical protein